jgi:recombination associated protein RdgC
MLRKTLGTLNVVLPATTESPESAMTRWIMDDASWPAGFTLEDECELQAGEGAEGTVRCKYIDVSSDEVRAHVASGRRVKKLAMNWRERLSFVLQDDLSVKRLRFDSEIADEVGEAGDDEASRFDADFALMSAELAAFIPELLAALDSED